MLESLAEFGIFEGLTHDELDAMSSLVRTSSVSEGERILQKGDPASALFLVRSGKVELHCEVEFYNAPVRITLDIAYPGDACGWSALIPPYQYTLSAVAVQDCDFWLLDQADIRSACEANTHLGYVFMKNVAQVVGQRFDTAQQMLVREVQAELAKADPLADPQA